jgi:hypothetical protein
MHYAVANNNVEILKTLIESKNDINIQDEVFFLII